MKKSITKGLQKFTFQEKWNQLIKLQKVSQEDISRLFESKELPTLNKKLNDYRSSLKGDDLVKFWDQFENYADQETRNNIWDRNHHVITQEIHNYLNEYGLFPPKGIIAENTKLSRPTIDKHLSEYATNPFFQVYQNQLKFMSHKVISKLLKSALNGDVKASRLFLEMTGQLNKDQGSATYIKNQNNYLQINNTMLTAETLKKLPQEKILQIEELINSNSKKT